jgi:SAM-dependent methyltransferase
VTGACELWIKDRLDRDHTIRGRVLELGSRDVNGSIRPAFTDVARFPEYVGLDIEPGSGVDIQGVSHHLPFHAGYFGVVVTCEMLEHDPAFWITFAECQRVLRVGGWLLMTTRAFGFPRHDYPNDYWRFTTDGIEAALRLAGFRYADAVEDHADLGVFAAAMKEPGHRPKPWPPLPAPFLSEEVVMDLRERMDVLIPLGITAMADAFRAVADDRARAMRLLFDVARSELQGPEAESVRKALGVLMEERDGDDKEG